MKYKDLHDRMTANKPNRRQFLYCPECHEKYSADAGDYFLRNPIETIVCGQDGTALVLAEERKGIEVLQR